MKIIKVVVLLVGMFLISGCTIDYNILIGKDMVVEEAIITAYESDTTSKKELFSNYKDEYPIYIDQEFKYYDPYKKDSNFTYYNKTYQELENGYIFKYSVEMPKDKMLKARSVNTLFESKMHDYDENGGFYYLAFNKPLLFKEYNQIDSIKINVKFTSDIIILNTNCDSYENGVYTWIVKNNNFNGINIKYIINEDSNSYNDTFKNDEEKSWTQKNFGVIMGGAFIILVVVIGVVSKINSKKR